MFEEPRKGDKYIRNVEEFLSDDQQDCNLDLNSKSDKNSSLGNLLLAKKNTKQ